ncbi:MAG TPA: 2-oxoglutarate dehydrogenase complex dihydrolipoyllysine-residue succinyltransferase [Vicinamibacterales bacterium]|jgi:2-oxoglutarate dehydrogenase E2 component (dihydrolipoamide succinyltransferase)
MSNIVVPELGESVVEARVARWLKKAGDQVEVGEPLVELETEKVDLEVNADKRGVIASIAHQEGDDVKIGDVLGVIDENGAGVQAAPPSGNGSKKPAAPTPERPAPARAEQAPAPARVEHAPAPAVSPKPQAKAEAPAPPSESEAPARASGSERPAPASESEPRTAREARTAPREAKPSARTEERVRMSKRRATIARRLVEAQHNAAMLTTFNEVDMSSVMSLRERQKEAFKKAHGVGLGIASFFVKASIAALREFPLLNAEIQGDEIVYKRYYDIGMAVGAEGGLVVPVLRDADRLTFPQVEKAIRDFAAKAQDGTLTLEDLRGGTFTITNGGVFGSLMSTPILNPPQVAILGLHKIQDRVVPVNGQPAIRPMMYVALSYDHRIVDGREAVQFLVRIKHYVEDPGNLLLEG